jgi:hypothetical protein
MEGPVVNRCSSELPARRTCESDHLRCVNARQFYSAFDYPVCRPDQPQPRCLVAIVNVFRTRGYTATGSSHVTDRADRRRRDSSLRPTSGFAPQPHARSRRPIEPAVRLKPDTTETKNRKRERVAANGRPLGRAGDLAVVRRRFAEHPRGLFAVRSRAKCPLSTRPHSGRSGFHPTGSKRSAVCPV